MTACVVRGCSNPRHETFFVCYAHAEHLAVKKQPIEQGAIPYVEPPKPKRPPIRDPGEIHDKIEYYRVVARAKSA